MLTNGQKQSRLEISKYLLFLYEVAQDETWVHHFDSEAKKQSLQWKHPGSPPP